MKRLFLLALLSLTFVSAHCQVLTIKVLQDKVEDIDVRINTLFQGIDRPLYSNYQNEATYARYFQTATEILDELAGLEKQVKQISGEYNSDKDFYIRWANLNICQLKIRKNKENLLSYLKFKDDPQVYEDMIILWKKEEGVHQKDLRRQIERLRIIEPSNIYASAYDAIAYFFEGDNEMAITKMETCLRNVTTKGKVNLGEDELDNLFGFCSSWLSYFYFVTSDMTEFNEHLTNTITAKGPSSSVSWAIDAKRAFDRHKKEGTDLFIRDFVPVTTNINRNYYEQKVTFDEKGRLTSHKIDEVVLKDYPAPEQIALYVKGLYKKLNDLEKGLWSDVQHQFNKDAKKEKKLYKNFDVVMFEINPGKKTKKSYAPTNVGRHLKLLELYNDLIIKLSHCRAIWSSLIKANPDIPLYRLYRIKTDLLIHKIHRDSPRYMRAFDYLKYADKKVEKPSNVFLSEYKAQLLIDVTSEVRGDLLHLEKLIAGSPSLSIAKIEAALVIDGPNVAMNQIQSLEKSITPDLLMDGQKPDAYFHAAKVCAMFNDRQTERSEFKDARNALSDFNYEGTETFLTSIRGKATFLIEEKEVVSKFKKQPLYTRYVPEWNLPFIHFPQNVACNYITVPPLFMAKNIRLTLPGVASQYFRLAILPALDMTNRAESYKNSITDMFYTALFETKRFSLMDRMEVTRVQNELSKNIQEKLLNRMGDNPMALSDTSKSDKVAKQEMELLNQVFQKNDESTQAYKGIADRLQQNSEGVMLLYITNDLKSVDGNGGQIGIDYRIISNKSKNVLFAGNKNVGYRYDKQSETLLFAREDVGSVANEIKLKFPNPDLQDNMKIIARRGNRITINMGKNMNIAAGLEGFVVKIEEDLSGNKLIRYRAEFIIKDVFAETCTAELIGDTGVNSLRNAINESIEIGEPVKMK